MSQIGPDTGLASGDQDQLNYDGYGYQDPTIRSFSLTHFDGAGVPIAGDLPFMPTTGAVSSDQSRNASPFEHASERAAPGYYAATLARYGTRVELTATQRAAMMRTTFPSTAQANVLLYAGSSIGGAQPASVTVAGDRTLTGWTSSHAGYRVFFKAVFDRPFTRSGTLGVRRRLRRLRHHLAAGRDDARGHQLRGRGGRRAQPRRGAAGEGALRRGAPRRARRLERPPARHRGDRRRRRAPRNLLHQPLPGAADAVDLRRRRRALHRASTARCTGSPAARTTTRTCRCGTPTARSRRCSS